MVPELHRKAHGTFAEGDDWLWFMNFGMRETRNTSFSIFLAAVGQITFLQKNERILQ